MLKEMMLDKRVLNIYMWGSRVYGCFTEDSDYDYNVVVQDDYEPFVDNFETEEGHFNMFRKTEWKNYIVHNRIEALESLFCGEKYILKETIKFELKIDLVELRRSISMVACNSYDKCRKKLTKSFEPYIAKKSLWHSIRIVMFGIQCAKFGKIVDFSEANKYHTMIVNNKSNDWNYYKENWHTFCNNLRTEFRKLTEEAWRNKNE